MLGKFCCFDLEDADKALVEGVDVFVHVDGLSSLGRVGDNNSVRFAVMPFGGELILSQRAVKLNRELKEKPHRSAQLIIDISDV